MWLLIVLWTVSGLTSYNITQFGPFATEGSCHSAFVGIRKSMSTSNSGYRIVGATCEANSVTREFEQTFKNMPLEPSK